MSPEAALAGTAPSPAGTKPLTISRLVRRVHMYLGLFLAPWMFMYAASTLVMNHREFVQRLYPTKTPPMVVERQLDYSRSFPPDTTPEQRGEMILGDLGLKGAHRVTGGKAGKPLVIERQKAWTPRRMTWDPTTQKIVVEKQQFRSTTFLERMHRRRGYQQPYAVDDTWAFTVDLAVITMVFWSLSGLWLWWELKSTRWWGAACAGLGLALFVFFLILI